MTTVLVEDLSDVKKRVTFEIESEKVKDVVDTQYNDLKKNIQLKGFRKGKAPLSLIKSYFKKQVEADAARKIIDETFEPALKKEKLNAISVLNLDPGPLEDGEVFKYTAEIEIPPKLDVTGYKGLDLTRVVRKVNDSLIEERLEALRQDQARLIPLPEGQGLGEGDQVAVDIKASTEEGEDIPSLTVSDYHLEIGREFYLPGFDEHLKGMVQGESKEIEQQLPETYPNKEIAGKKAKFVVTVNEGKVTQLPELDDDLAKDLGEYESLQELRDDLRERYEKIYKLETKKELEEQIRDALIEANPFDAPEAMVENRIDTTLNESYHNLAMQGIDPSILPPPSTEQRERIRPMAEKMVKYGLLINSIAEQEGVEVNDDELEEGIQERAKEINVTVDFMKDRLEQTDSLEDFKSGLVHEKVVDMILDQAQITDKEEEIKSEEDTEDNDVKDE